MTLAHNLDGKLLIFSRCLVGTDHRAMQRLLEVSGARAIIAYRNEIDDAYAFVAETLLYSRIFDTRWRPGKLVRRIRIALQALEVKWGSGARDARSPLICFSC